MRGRPDRAGYPDRDGRPSQSEPATSTRPVRDRVAAAGLLPGTRSFADDQPVWVVRSRYCEPLADRCDPGSVATLPAWLYASWAARMAALHNAASNLSATRPR